MKLIAYAKLNLALDILGKRPDGYHELDTIMQSISLFDIVSIEKADAISVRMDISDVDEKQNTAYRAAELFTEHTGAGGASISIEKHIPSMAGLGGSSADAAAVLIGLNQLYSTKLDDQAIANIAKQIGADVSFSLIGGTARARGIGEKLEPLNLKKTLYFVVVKPFQGVSTAKAFAAYKKTPHISIESVSYALQKGDIELFKKYSKNALGIPALNIAPDILKAASAIGAYTKAFMSGSGSSMFGVFEDESSALTAAQYINGEFEMCGVFKSVDKGVEILGEN